MDDKRNSSYEEYLLDEAEKKPEKGFCSCFSGCCSCCCRDEVEISKKFYINKWRKYLSQENETNLSRPFIILTNLWAHKNVIRDLENIRLNPNLISEKNIRNDLEFYIPQLCTFLIFGEYEVVEEFLAFLCKACYASFFFAHRIIWFLKSLQLKDNTAMNDKIEYILQLIQTIFKSEKDKTKLEKLNISNSVQYVDYIKRNQFNFLYSQTDLKDENGLRQEQKEISTISKETTNLIKTYSEKLLAYADKNENLVSLKKLEEIEDFTWDFPIKQDELFINLFRKNEKVSSTDVSNYSVDLVTSPIIKENINYYQDIMVHEEINTNIGKVLFKNDIEVEQIKLCNKPNNSSNINNFEDNNEYSSSLAETNDVNLLSFMSGINFIETLCSICERTKEIPQNEQLSFIRKEITEINKILPANIYIPFLKDSIRNYIICHIPVTDIKIFRTKNRAPYMLTIEVIRIDEIIQFLLKKERTQKKNPITLYNNEGLDYLPEEEIDKMRCHSMTTTSINAKKKFKFKNKLESNKRSMEISQRANFNTFIENDYETKRKRSTTMMMLAESDIKLSKPLIISNLETEIKRAPLRGEKKIILEENEDFEESFIKENMEDIVKRRLTMYPMDKDKNKKNMSLTEESILNKKNPFNNKNFKDDNKIFLRERNFTTSGMRPERKYLLNYDNDINEDKEEANNFNQNIQINESRNSFDTTNKENADSKSKLAISEINDKLYENIFGETIEEQSARIKKFSPFGQFNTWQIFKMIIKSGEDLRQEQFATQLINEFHQIFKLEKVKCWVNTYEIVATGNNVGIIECVPNAISIDQLKRKIGVNSLRSFFDNYFGPANSSNFHKAMKNFIRSLAGYSLVCYFLQIKDRHNANILLDNEGHLIHIDFGFLLSNAPGKGIKFESAPFKLTNELVETMGGVNSKYFTKFRKLLWQGFIAIAKHSQKILILVEMMYCGHGKHLPCFENKEHTIEALKSRFCPRPDMNKVDYMRHVDILIEQSIDNWRTRWYDKFQYYFQGIFY